MLVFQGVHQSSLKRLLFHAQSMNALPGYIIMGLLVENAGQPRRDDRLSHPVIPNDGGGAFSTSVSDSECISSDSGVYLGGTQTTRLMCTGSADVYVSDGFTDEKPDQVGSGNRLSCLPPSVAVCTTSLIKSEKDGFPNPS